MRESGILLPIFALPSKYGIGCFSREAYEFVDQLKEAGQKKWQILPLGPTGYGDSPYQSFSTYAGNPYFIDLEKLIDEGLLNQEECAKADCGKANGFIDYEKLYKNRFRVLRKSFKRFEKTDDYEIFVKENSFWLDDYCLYMAIKDEQQGKGWSDWEKPLRNREDAAITQAKGRLAEEMDFYRFLQYEFLKQWKQLREYANKKGIQIIGDIPIYVAFDSADTWSQPELFDFDDENIPVAVSGCPPDGFSATGQLWGSPLYDWEYHKKTGYRWWIERIKYCFKLYDVVRIDHFRGFDEYYSIPYGDETAENGKWLPGPGYGLFEQLEKSLGKLNIIAEDLGFVTDSVRQLLEQTGYPGMKVLQLAFDVREETNYLPHTYTSNAVVYTGTHDNSTTRDWYQNVDPECQKMVRDYVHNSVLEEEQVASSLIALAMASVADLCIIPIQDYLNLEGEARINTPSVLGNNWMWRLTKGQVTDNLIKEIAHITKVYGRA